MKETKIGLFLIFIIFQAVMHSIPNIVLDIIIPKLMKQNINIKHFLIAKLFLAILIIILVFSFSVWIGLFGSGY